MLHHWSSRRRLLTRLASLERQVQALDQQLGKAEEKLDARKRPGLFAILQALAPLFTGGVLLILGLLFKDSVSFALEQRKIDQAYAAEAKELLSILLDRDTALEDAEVAATTLGSFGEWAVPPLIIALREPDSVASLAARKGLWTAALADPAAVCRGLASVIENRSQLYPWSAHEIAVEQLGRLSCWDTAAALRDYETFLESGDETDLAEIVDEASRPNNEALRMLKATVEVALRRMGGARESTDATNEPR